MIQKKIISFCLFYRIKVSTENLQFESILDAKIESFHFCNGFEGLNVLMLAALKVSIGPFEKSGGDAFNYFVAGKLTVDFLRLSFALFRVSKEKLGFIKKKLFSETFLEKKKLGTSRLQLASPSHFWLWC